MRMESRPPRLLDQLREAIRVRRFILFHGKRHSRDMAAGEVTAFLTYLANERNVSASIQNQAKSALLFLYKQALGIELPWLNEIVQAKRGTRLPVVLTPHEVRDLLGAGVVGP
jgi:site-specific recombinase XerD